MTKEESRKAHLMRYHVRAQLNFRLGLTSKGRPRKRRENFALLPREKKVFGHAGLLRRECLARYHRRAEKFHTQGLTFNGHKYLRPLKRVLSTLDIAWRKLRVGFSNQEKELTI